MTNTASRTLAEKANQPSGVTLGALMAYSFAMGAISLLASLFEPAASNPAIEKTLYGFAAVFALIIVIALTYGVVYAIRAAGDATSDTP